MIRPLPPLRMTGGLILRDGQLQSRSLSMADGRITRGPLPEVDLTGHLILPGIVDLHGTAPGPLAEHDRNAARQGVTTALRAQAWGWEDATQSPAAAEAELAALSSHRIAMLADLRLTLTAEVHLVDEGPRLIETVRRHRIGLVLFEDRLDALLERMPASPDPAIAAALARRGQVPRHLCALADAFDAMGTLYGSRADPDAETRERNSMIGARLAVFPASHRAAAAAHAMMSPVILPAPEVLSGGPAASLIAAGLGDALASGDDLSALAQAAFRLTDLRMMSFAKAWAMISSRPADILRLPDRGRLDPGQRADLVVIQQDSRQVVATLSRGRLIFATPALQDRLLGVVPSLAENLSLAAE